MAKKAVKQAKLTDSPLEASASNDISASEPAYTPEEQGYRSLFLQKLEAARTLRESSHDKFNGVGYTKWYEDNDKAANSHTPPRKNADDVNIVTGTTREKVLAIVSNVINLIFRTNFKAFDKDDNEEVELGEAMSDCVERSTQVELWEEKKIFPCLLRLQSPKLGTKNAQFVNFILKKHPLYLYIKTIPTIVLVVGLMEMRLILL